MTGPELDALVKRLENVSLQVGFPSRTILDSAVIRQAIDTITTLRAQLADVQAEVAFMQTCGVIEMMTRNPNINSYVIEWEGRTIRAEAERDAAQAALAAQIAVDAKSCDRIAGNTKDFFAETRRAAGMCAAAIRAQPHDRTALDRIRRAEREKALREAASEMEDERAKQAILAMIEQEDN